MASMNPELAQAILDTASKTGLSADYLRKLAMVESSGNPNSASNLSSAKGAFQFIDSTAKRYGLADPFNPTQSADAAARLTMDNRSVLSKALGRDPTAGELYLAHQQGSGGASKLLANPNAPVEDVIGAAAARNNGSAPGMTAGQFAAKWTNRFAGIDGQVAVPTATTAVASAAPSAMLSLGGAAQPAATAAPEQPAEPDQLQAVLAQIAKNSMAETPLEAPVISYFKPTVRRATNGVA